MQVQQPLQFLERPGKPRAKEQVGGLIGRRVVQAAGKRRVVRAMCVERQARHAVAALTSVLWVAGWRRWKRSVDRCCVSLDLAVSHCLRKHACTHTPRTRHTDTLTTCEQAMRERANAERQTQQQLNDIHLLLQNISHHVVGTPGPGHTETDSSLVQSRPAPSASVIANAETDGHIPSSPMLPPSLASLPLPDGASAVAATVDAPLDPSNDSVTSARISLWPLGRGQ